MYFSYSNKIFGWKRVLDDIGLNYSDASFPKKPGGLFFILDIYFLSILKKLKQRLKKQFSEFWNNEKRGYSNRPIGPRKHTCPHISDCYHNIHTIPTKPRFSPKIGQKTRNLPVFDPFKKTPYHSFQRFRPVSEIMSACSSVFENGKFRRLTK